MIRRMHLLLLIFLLLWAVPSLADRIVAIGDLHGDLAATRQALQLAGAVDPSDHWIGGSLVVVQTGDQLDRGDQERAILHLLNRLQEEALAAGGALYLLNGNHELMNARLDLRYVTEGGFADFADVAAEAPLDSLLLAYAPAQRGRVAAFRPGGPYARLLAERPVILVLGETLFVHGGLLPGHLEYGIDRINTEVRQWLLGEGDPPPFIHKGESPTWSRTYSDGVDEVGCAQLAAVLAELGVKRMVVGHTVQEEGITAYCDDQVWCIDSGIAEHYGNHVQVLEIQDGQVRALP